MHNLWHYIQSIPYKMHPEDPETRHVQTLKQAYKKLPLPPTPCLNATETSNICLGIQHKFTS
jgi:hypothetical protein